MRLNQGLLEVVVVVKFYLDRIVVSTTEWVFIQVLCKRKGKKKRKKKI